MQLNELFNQTVLNDGINDPHIYKAIIIVGGPGSGKSWVVNNIIGGTGLKVVNSDIFFEYLAAKKNFKLKHAELETDEKYDLRFQAWNMKNRQLEQYVKERLGLVLDGTGRNYDRIISTTETLKKLGYEVIMIAVNTDVNTALTRNRSRERTVPEDFLKLAHSEIQNNLGKFQNYFNENFIIFDNTSGAKQDLDLLNKKIRKFINTPVKKHFIKENSNNFSPTAFFFNKETGYDGLLSQAQKLSKFIKKECKFYLSQSNNGKQPCFRGIKTKNINSAGVAFIKPTRTNRKPTDSSQKEHDILNLYIKKANKIANRTNSIFVSGNIDLAETYGKIYVVFPIGKFNYTWSKTLFDWSEEVDFLQTKTDNVLTGLSGKPISIQGDDNTFDKALKSDNEIMIKCDTALFVEYNFYKNYLKYVLSDKSVPKMAEKLYSYSQGFED